MENEERYSYELTVAVAERSAKRWFIFSIIVLAICLITNISWFIYENSFEDIVITQENEDGYNSFIGDDGDINYGETDN